MEPKTFAGAGCLQFSAAEATVFCGACPAFCGIYPALFQRLFSRRKKGFYALIERKGAAAMPGEAHCFRGLKKHALLSGMAARGLLFFSGFPAGGDGAC